MEGSYKKETMNRSRLKEAIRNLTADVHAKIARVVIERPQETYREIAEQFGVSEATVMLAAAKHGISRSPGPKARVAAVGEQTP